MGEVMRGLRGEYRESGELLEMWNERLERQRDEMAQTLPIAAMYAVAVDDAGEAVKELTEKMTKFAEGGESFDLEEFLKNNERAVEDLDLSVRIGTDALGAYRSGLATVATAADDTSAKLGSLRAQVRGLSSDLAGISGILGFIPGVGGIARGISIASSVLGIGGRFIGSDTPAVGGDKVGKVAASGAASHVSFNFPAPMSATDAVRDPMIARTFAAQVENHFANGGAPA
jgi:hypothetical protein